MTGLEARSDLTAGVRDDPPARIIPDVRFADSRLYAPLFAAIGITIGINWRYYQAECERYQDIGSDRHMVLCSTAVSVWPSRVAGSPPKPLHIS